MNTQRRFLELACRAACQAGKIHLKYFKPGLAVKTKKDSFDLLTAADIKAERAVVALIRREFPGHNILAEEHDYGKNSSEFTWIIDPLDGTNNFACGIPIFCVSIALAHGNQLLAGAVYDATRDELFYASKGRGAFLNKRRIRVNKAATLKESLLITGFYYDRGKRMIETLEAIKQFHFKRVIGIRRLGAAALDMCYVACGRAAGFWEFTLSPWDFCAGKLLIEEAGGKVSGCRGEEVPLYEKHFIVASNRKIHPLMLSILRTVSS